MQFEIGEVDELGVNPEEPARFYQNHWDRPTVLAIPSFYNWQFRQAPENRGRDCCVVAVGTNQTIYGIMGLNVRQFILGGSELPGAELTTWVVSSQARGLGIGKRIMKYLQGKYRVLMGMGISESALPVYLSHGFNYLRYIPRFFRIFDPAATEPYAKINRLGAYLIEQWADNKRGNYHAREVSVGEIAKRSRYLRRSFNHFSREEAALTWRYQNHPVFNYRFFEVVGPGQGVSIVFRVNEINGFQIFHLTDVFGDSDDVQAALWFVDDYCRKRGVAAADFYCAAEGLSRHFRANGWFSILDDYFAQLMHLFSPPEWRQPPTTSLVCWTNSRQASIFDRSTLYVTKEDLDLDRPTIEAFQGNSF